MHTYQRQGDRFVAGLEFSAAPGMRHWRPMKSFAIEAEAAMFVCALNGGDITMTELSHLLTVGV